MEARDLNDIANERKGDKPYLYKSTRVGRIDMDGEYGRVHWHTPTTEIDGSKVVKKFSVLRLHWQDDGYVYITEDGRVFRTIQGRIVKMSAEDIVNHMEEANEALDDYQIALETLQKGESK